MYTHKIDPPILYTICRCRCRRQDIIVTHDSSMGPYHSGRRRSGKEEPTKPNQQQSLIPWNKQCCTWIDSRIPNIPQNSYRYVYHSLSLGNVQKNQVSHCRISMQMNKGTFLLSIDTSINTIGSLYMKICSSSTQSKGYCQPEQLLHIVSPIDMDWLKMSVEDIWTTYCHTISWLLRLVTTVTMYLAINTSYRLQTTSTRLTWVSVNNASATFSAFIGSTNQLVYLVNTVPVTCHALNQLPSQCEHVRTNCCIEQRLVHDTVLPTSIYSTQSIHTHSQIMYHRCPCHPIHRVN
jgi:hypothetical protein